MAALAAHVIWTVIGRATPAFLFDEWPDLAELYSDSLVRDPGHQLHQRVARLKSATARVAVPAEPISATWAKGIWIAHLHSEHLRRRVEDRIRELACSGR